MWACWESDESEKKNLVLSIPFLQERGETAAVVCVCVSAIVMPAACITIQKMTEVHRNVHRKEEVAYSTICVMIEYLLGEKDEEIF